MGLPSNLKEKDQYLSIGTFRKNGEIKRTPVWFANDDEKLYVYTDLASWKVKRIRNNPKVEFATTDSRGSKLGETQEGIARIVDDKGSDHANDLFQSKYGFQYKIFKFWGKIRGNESTYIEISYH